MKITTAKRVDSIPPSGIREFFELVLGMKEIISLGIGEPDYVTPWHICESGIYALENGYTSYTSNQGLLSLRKAISQYLKRKYRLSYDPEREILITVGTSEAYDLAIRALVNPGDEVIVTDPGYISYDAVVKLAGGIPKYLPLQESNFKIKPAGLKKAISKKTKLLVLNYPSNPSGITYSKKELEKIAQIVRRNSLLVISDEIYSELTYDFQHIPFPALPGMKVQTIYINGFSKAFAMTGWRIGFACGPQEVIQAMNKIHQYTMLCAPIMSQLAAQEALLNGENALQEMKQEYRRRRDYLVERLREIGLEFPFPEGAFYVFVSVKETGLTGEEFAYQLLRKKKVAVVPGVAFGSGNRDYIRISYTAEFEKLKKALNLIEEFLRSR